jgi:hypothetical protein
MQSYLQYQRLGRYLEGKIKEHGVQTAANIADGSVAGSTCKCMRNYRTVPTTKDENTCTDIQTPPVKADEQRVGEALFIVKFESPTDTLNPQTWSNALKWTYTFLIGATGFIVSGAAAFDTPVTSQAAAYFGVSEEVALLSTTLYMIALGLGSLVSAPFSEIVGRNPIYIICEHICIL